MRFEVVTSTMQLDEIRRASRYPALQAILPAAKVGTMVNNLQRALVLEHLVVELVADDPDDAFLLTIWCLEIAGLVCCNAVILAVV